MITAIVLVCEGHTIDSNPVTGDSLAIANVLNGIPGWLDAISRMQKSFSS
jgi:hypothetical protein